MRKSISLFFLILLLLTFTFIQTAQAAVYKWIKVGKYQNYIRDVGPCQSDNRYIGFYYFDNFIQWNLQFRNWGLGEKGWTDEEGTFREYKYALNPLPWSDEGLYTYAIPDEEGFTIRKYMRYQLPKITVDGYRLDEPFPFDDSEELNPDHILGTADIMLESWINTDMGITIHQIVLAWSQTNHDDYILYDWRLVNTGDRDGDGEIELPDQTFDSLYFMRQFIADPGSHEDWANWFSAYGERPGDSLRILWAYDNWRETEHDDFGDPHPQTGFLRNPEFLGEAILHVDSAYNNPADDPTQPQGTWTGQQGNSRCGAYSYQYDGTKYERMKYGLNVHPTYYTPYMEGCWPGTHHCLRMDEQGYKYPEDFPWWRWAAGTSWTCGPFTIPPGDSIRVVWATVMGSITPETAWEVGTAWKNGTCTWDGPDKLPPPVDSFPELVPTANDSAKDNWVMTGKDSLFKNALNARWNARRYYEIPIPPPAPSVVISSRPNKVLIEWGNESESVPDFAGYRVYRAVGKSDSTYTMIFECGAGTANPLVHFYEDTDAQRGVAYFYHVAAFDDGTHPEVSNPVGVNGVAESLESGRYLNRSTRAAYLTREPGEDLDAIRVVPNPFNIFAKELQYPGEPDKIMFVNLPPYCTIKIYNEKGDLIKTIEHTDGSGDEAWASPTGEYFQVTENNQIPVSGLYIARIETPDGTNKNVKFLIVR